MFTLIRYVPPVYLFINGILYLVVAWLFLSGSQAWFDSLQLATTGPAGSVELQSLYIGLMGGLGLFCLVASLVGSLVPAGVLLNVVCYGGLVMVRGWGILSGDIQEPLQLQLLTAESISLLAGLLSGYCLYRQARRKRNPYF